MDTSELRGLTLNIYKHNGRGSSNGGVSSRCDQITLVGMIPGGDRTRITLFPASSRVSSVPSENAPAAVLVRREVLGRVVFHVEPLDRPQGRVGFMAGGTYVATSDSRLQHLHPAVPYGALSFHDRTETPAQYAALSG
jgi:hypothetical protein